MKGLEATRSTFADAGFHDDDLHEPIHVQHVHSDLGWIRDDDQSILRSEFFELKAKVRPYMLKDKGPLQRQRVKLWFNLELLERRRWMHL